MVKKSLRNDKKSVILFILIFVVYALIYLTKNCFSAAMAPIVAEGIMTKSETGLIAAMFYLIYAPFQIVGGFAADRYSPYKLLLWGTLGAGICNLLVYFFSENYVAMLIIWSLNAVIQFGIWPAVFKIITSQLKEVHRVKGVFYISFTATAGLVLSYVCAAIITDWKINFLLSAIILFACVAALMVVYPRIEKAMVPDEILDAEPMQQKKQKSEKQKGVLSLVIRSGALILLVVYAIQGLLNLGLKALAPVMLMENYESVSPAFANILNIILVVASSGGLFFSRLPFFKKFSDVSSIAIMFAVSIPMLVVVTFIGNVSIALIVVVLSLLLISVSSMTVFFSYITKAFEKFGLGGTLAGLFNCMSAVGLVLANYVFAKLADAFGWGFTTKSWLIIAIVSFALTALTIPIWRNFKKKMNIDD
jgi:sugar phosphate permease